MLNKNKYLNSYLKIIKEDIQLSKGQLFANRNKVKYIPETNTVDCLNKIILFKNEDLTDGTFDFKLINLSDDCRCMFENCTPLITIPDDFKIPDSANYCSAMFAYCRSLTRLPDDFKIPNGVIKCGVMFAGCTLLERLPNNFTIPNSVTSCIFMFDDCTSLTHLPNNFTIPIDSDYKNIFRDTKFEGVEDQYLTIGL